MLQDPHTWQAGKKREIKSGAKNEALLERRFLRPVRAKVAPAGGLANAGQGSIESALSDTADWSSELVPHARAADVKTAERQRLRTESTGAGRTAAAIRVMPSPRGDDPT